MVLAAIPDIAVQDDHPVSRCQDVTLYTFWRMRGRNNDHLFEVFNTIKDREIATALIAPIACQPWPCQRDVQQPKEGVRSAVLILIGPKTALPVAVTRILKD